MRSLRALSAIASCLLLSGCFFVNIPLGNYTDFREVTMEEGSRQKILLLDVDGVITSGPESESLFDMNDSTVNEVAAKLALARKDPNIKAVILRVDSPGGGVTASDVVYRQLKEYKEETKVPVYVSMLDLAASGGYYISMAADEVYAHPTTITGSIGVIAIFPQFEDLGHKIGLYAEVIKSGENKDITGGFNNMTPEQRQILQTTIDDMYKRFVTVVKEGRPKLTEETIRTLADGRIYTAEQATANGLIDGVMYLDDLSDHIREKIKSPNARVVMYRKTGRETVDSLYAKSPAVRPQARGSIPATTTVNLIHIDAHSLTPGTRGEVFNYLWTP